MQINNTPNKQSFGQLVIHPSAKKVIDSLGKDSPILSTLQYAREVLKDSKYHVLVDRNLNPVITTPKGERLAGTFKIVEPKYSDHVVLKAANDSRKKENSTQRGKVIFHRIMTTDYKSAREIYRKLNKLSPLEFAVSIAQYMDTVFRCSQNSTTYQTYRKLQQVTKSGYQDQLAGLFSGRKSRIN